MIPKTSADSSPRYDSALSLLIIIGSLAVTVFFQIDHLFGAIGVRAFYHVSGIVLALVFFLTALSLPAWYKVVPVELSIGLGLLLGVILVALNVVLGWWAATLVLIPLVAIILGLFLVFLVWMWDHFRSTLLSRKLRRLTTISVAVIMAIYSLGIGSLPEYSEFDFRGKVLFRSNYYYLSLKWGWLDDPDTLILYQCNQFGLNCSDVYSISDYYLERTIELIPEPDNTDLLIRVDGKPLYTYHSTQ